MTWVVRTRDVRRRKYVQRGGRKPLAAEKEQVLLVPPGQYSVLLFGSLVSTISTSFSSASARMSYSCSSIVAEVPLRFSFPGGQG
jgi:hypothetical protein